MDDLISRLDAITIPILPKEHRRYQTMNLDDAYESGWIDCQKCIENLPSVQPERKKGEWTIDEDCEGKSRTVTCNLCGHEEFNWHNPNFCPNCGADMRGGRNE